MSQPIPAKQISQEEIRAIYAQGEDAVIVLVEELLERLRQLETCLVALVLQCNKDSCNSSKPPSGDGFGKRIQSLRKKGERASGGQSGHPGSTLAWSAQVDEVVTHRALQYEMCGQGLNDIAVESWLLRQVHDLPPLRLAVSEHQAETKRCPGCGILNQAAFPPEVNSVVQYGSGIKGLMVYLIAGQLLPSMRVCDVLRKVVGCELSEGTLYNTCAQCDEQLEPLEQGLKAGIQQTEVGHFDQTGLRVNGKLMWLHVACTEALTYYFIHPKRGQVVMDEMEILPNFNGTSIHDGWSSYGHYDCEHGLCNAHHLRELLFVVERYQQEWANEMMTLLVEIKTHVETAKAAGLGALSATQIADFEQRYQTLIEQGLKDNPSLPTNSKQPPSKGGSKQSLPKNLLDRLSKQSTVLAFMYDFRMPFDNNQAERDLRMMKLKQKISEGFRSLRGAQRFCRIRGYISTLRKQGIDVLDALKQVFTGNLIFPALQPE
jgi:transposase